jgi:putative peptide zinc metalloprotease protein
VTGLQTHRTTDPGVPHPAEGLELIGGYEGSGFKEKPYLVRRADGQVIQLSRLLYLVAEAVDGERDFGEIADRVTREFGRGINADGVRYLVENKLRPLGVVAAADGSSPELRRVSLLLGLRFSVGLVPERVVRAIAAFFWPLFLPPIVVVMLTSLIAFDVWLFFFHGGIGGIVSTIREMIYQPATFLVLGYCIGGISVALHECGHVTACRYGGAKPGVIGAGIYIVWLVYYSDVTDSYRLSKAGRLRTDLGGVYFDSIFALVLAGAYFITGYEPLLVFIVFVHLDILEQFTPFLRLDGYYVVSDLTGVPDLFGRVKPVLKSLIPGREPDQRVKELKPWARAVVTAWVLMAVPALVFTFTMLAYYLPLLLATAWDSFLLHSEKVSSAFGAGKIIESIVGLAQIGALIVPVVGTVLFLALIGRRFLVAPVWNRRRQLIERLNAVKGRLVRDRERSSTDERAQMGEEETRR